MVARGFDVVLVRVRIPFTLARSQGVLEVVDGVAGSLANSTLQIHAFGQKKLFRDYSPKSVQPQWA